MPVRSIAIIAFCSAAPHTSGGDVGPKPVLDRPDSPIVPNAPPPSLSSRASHHELLATTRPPSDPAPRTPPQFLLLAMPSHRYTGRPARTTRGPCSWQSPLPPSSPQSWHPRHSGRSTFRRPNESANPSAWRFVSAAPVLAAECAIAVHFPLLACPSLPGHAVPIGSTYRWLALRGVLARKPISGALYPTAATLHNYGLRIIDHRRLHIPMSQQLLRFECHARPQASGSQSNGATCPIALATEQGGPGHSSPPTRANIWRG